MSKELAKIFLKLEKHYKNKVMNSTERYIENDKIIRKEKVSSIYSIEKALINQDKG